MSFSSERTCAQVLVNGLEDCLPGKREVRLSDQFNCLNDHHSVCRAVKLPTQIKKTILIVTIMLPYAKVGLAKENFGLMRPVAPGAMIPTFIFFMDQKSKVIFLSFNPCLAKPGYTLPLQTV